MDDSRQRTTSSCDRVDVSDEQNKRDESSRRMLEVQVMKQDDLKWDLAAFPQEAGGVPPPVASSAKRKNKNEILQHKEDSNKRTRLMKDENNEMRRKLKCIICSEKYVDVVTLPCCHLCTCKACVGNIDRCPRCQTVVKYKLKATLKWCAVHNASFNVFLDY